jgi:hypothetical protein
VSVFLCLTLWPTAAFFPLSAGMLQRAALQRPPSPCAHQLTRRQCAADSTVRQATEAWLNEWVINFKLCPWAKLTKGTSSADVPLTRLLVLRGGQECLEDHAAEAMREAEALRQVVCRHANEEATNKFFTTLLVFPDEAYLGQGPAGANCGAFPVVSSAITCHCGCHAPRGLVFSTRFLRPLRTKSLPWCHVC